MFRFVTAGESHGQALIAWISGLPAGIPIDFEFIQRELHRRQLGYGRGGRQKIEKDRVEALAGIRHGQTIGAPIATAHRKPATGPTGEKAPPGRKSSGGR